MTVYHVSNDKSKTVNDHFQHHEDAWKITSTRASGRCKCTRLAHPGLTGHHKAGGVTSQRRVWEDSNDYSFTVIWENERRPVQHRDTHFRGAFFPDTFHGAASCPAGLCCPPGGGSGPRLSSTPGSFTWAKGGEQRVLTLRLQELQNSLFQ